MLTPVLCLIVATDYVGGNTVSSVKDVLVIDTKTVTSYPIPVVSSTEDELWVIRMCFRAVFGVCHYDVSERCCLPISANLIDCAETIVELSVFC